MRYNNDLPEVGLRWLPRKDIPMVDSILGRAVALAAAFSACVAIPVLEVGRVA